LLRAHLVSSYCSINIFFSVTEGGHCPQSFELKLLLEDCFGNKLSLPFVARGKNFLENFVTGLSLANWDLRNTRCSNLKLNIILIVVDNSIPPSLRFNKDDQYNIQLEIRTTRVSKISVTQLASESPVTNGSDCFSCNDQSHSLQ